MLKKAIIFVFLLAFCLSSGPLYARGCSKRKSHCPKYTSVSKRRHTYRHCKKTKTHIKDFPCPGKKKKRLKKVKCPCPRKRLIAERSLLGSLFNTILDLDKKFEEAYW